LPDVPVYNERRGRIKALGYGVSDRGVGGGNAVLVIGAPWRFDIGYSTVYKVLGRGREFSKSSQLGRHGIADSMRTTKNKNNELIDDRASDSL
jgi:hypothetical protein